LEYRDTTLQGQDVLLDGNSFTGCAFRECRVIFSGMQPCELVACTFEQVSWVIRGPAAELLKLLVGLYHHGGQGGRQLVEDTFDNIRRGRQGPDPSSN